MEQNELLAKRKELRARCSELTTRSSDDTVLDMEAVAGLVKSKWRGVPDDMLQAIATSDAVEAEGFVMQKGRVGKVATSLQANPIKISKGFAGYLQIDLFSPTTDDDPVGAPAQSVAQELYAVFRRGLWRAWQVMTTARAVAHCRPCCAEA